MIAKKKAKLLNEKRYNYEIVFIKHVKIFGIGITRADFLNHHTLKAAKTTKAGIS